MESGYVTCAKQDIIAVKGYHPNKIDYEYLPHIRDEFNRIQIPITTVELISFSIQIPQLYENSPYTRIIMKCEGVDGILYSDRIDIPSDVILDAPIPKIEPGKMQMIETMPVAYNVEPRANLVIRLYVADAFYTLQPLPQDIPFFALIKTQCLLRNNK